MLAKIADDKCHSTAENLLNYITIFELTNDSEILGGQPVFKGTRVPVESLFDHLEAGVPLGEFLDDFPTVSKEQVIALLGIANKLLTSPAASREHYL